MKNKISLIVSLFTRDSNSTTYSVELTLSSHGGDIAMEIQVWPINMKLENKGITLRYCTDTIMPPILCQDLIRL